MNKKIIIVLLVFFVLIQNLICKDYIINKILYKKTLLSYNQPTLINVFLNPMNTKDVIIFFNEKKIEKINKKLKPVKNDNNTYLPNFSFEVANVQKENVLNLFIVLSQGITINSKTKIYFNKAIIVNNDNFQINSNKIFFIKAGSNKKNDSYNIKISNTNIIRLLEKIIFEDIFYYKLKSSNIGTSLIEIFKSNDYVEKKIEIPQQIIRVNVKN